MVGEYALYNIQENLLHHKFLNYLELDKKEFIVEAVIGIFEDESSQSNLYLVYCNPYLI